MHPKNTYIYTPSSPQQRLARLALRLVVWLVVVALVVVGVVVFHNYTKPFAITGTLPDVHKLNTQADSLIIDFSHPIKPGSAVVTSSPSVITTTKISGNTLTLSFAQRTLLSTKPYTIIIKSISPTHGKQLTNQRIVFTPSFAPPQTVGEQALLDAGLSTPQLNKINAHIAEFSPWAQKVVVDQANINYYPVNPNDQLGLWAISFSVQIDATTYKAIGYFYDTTDLQLKLFNPTTAQQLFVAGSPDAN